MSETGESAEVVPAASGGWAEKITIYDDAKIAGGGDWPVHVSTGIEIDGAHVPGVDLDAGWSVIGGGREAMLVTFVVDESRVTVERGRVDEGKVVGFTVGGHRLLAPRNPEWETLHNPHRPDRLRVHVYVREFEVRAAQVD